MELKEKLNQRYQDLLDGVGEYTPESLDEISNTVSMIDQLLPTEKEVVKQAFDLGELDGGLWSRKETPIYRNSETYFNETFNQ